MELIEGLKPFVASKDASGLSDFLEKTGWGEPALVALLSCTNLTLVRAAVWCLAHVGSMAANLPLASVLHHDDSATVELAENALWSVWLRGAPPPLHKRLCAAIRLTEQDCLDKALAEMDAITADCPDYAEAFDQRAIARFLKSDYNGASDDYQRACGLNPVHFGALAGVAHCHAALGRYQDALNVYRSVLSIHPRMEGIRQAIDQIKRMVDLAGGHTGRVPTFRAVS
jgi:tetratricopeptide (TPR) repeat protein